MAVDGSITISTALDNKQLEKEYAGLVKKIGALEEKLYKKQQAQLPLIREMDLLGAKAEEAKIKLDQMQNGSGFFTRSQIAEQVKEVQQLEREFDRAYNAVERGEKSIKEINSDLDVQKSKAGAVVQELERMNGMAGRMGGAVSQAADYMDKFAAKVKGLMYRAFVFTVVAQALRSMRDWMGKVMKTNAEATAAMAKLKAALLTLAQPLVDIIIPALIKFVNLLAAVATQLAQVMSFIFGASMGKSKASAKALYEQTEALDGVGAAAKDAGQQLAGFDELNVLSNNDVSGGAGGGAADITPDFSALDDATKGFENILDFVNAIAAGLLTWKIASAFTDSLQTAGGLAMMVAGAILLGKGYWEAWTKGVDTGNFVKMIAGMALVAGGLALVFGPAAAAIALIVGGLAFLVLGFKDIVANGVKVQNVLLVISGILAAGLGISLLVGSWIPMLIAGLAAIVLAFVAWQGNMEDLIDGVKTFLSGFIDFFKGAFTGDWSLALDGLKRMWEGFLQALLAILDSLKGGFNAAMDAVMEKLHLTGTDAGKVIESLKEMFGGLIDFLTGVFTGDWEKAWSGLVSIFKGIINLINSIFFGLINSVIDGLNWLTEKINTVIAKANSVPGINLPTLTPLQRIPIPMLATGAVIPPNREFMAVLGDQKHGRNLEGPEGLFRQMVKEEVGALLSQNNHGEEAKVVIMLNERVLGEAVIDYTNAKTYRTGDCPILLY